MKPTAKHLQLYCKEKTHRSSEGRTRMTYELHALLKDGRAMKFLSGLPEVEQGLYIERILEERLGIQDRRVPGELVHYWRMSPQASHRHPAEVHPRNTSHGAEIAFSMLVRGCLRSETRVG